MYINSQDMLGKPLQATDGDIGECHDFLFDDEQWVLRYMVADTHKWLPFGKKVLISTLSVPPISDSTHQGIAIALSKEEIKNAPDLDEHAPVSRQYEEQLFNYYGYAFYWMVPNLWGVHERPAPFVDAPADRGEAGANSDEEKTSLRSVREVVGYRVKILDQSVGHITELIFQREDWRVSHVVIVLDKAFGSQAKRLVPATYIKDILWREKAVVSSFSVGEIDACPEYPPAQLLKVG